MKKNICAKLIIIMVALASCGKEDEPTPPPYIPPGGDDSSGLHKCTESKIVDDMVFSTCCSYTTTAVQQGFDYDPVDNVVYFSQLNKMYRNLISWREPQVTEATDIASQYMGLRCFSHGNNIIIEHAEDGNKYVWAPNFGTRGDGTYCEPWIVSRLPLQATNGLPDIRNIDTEENYYFGVCPCWPAIDFENDLIAVCDYYKVYVYKLSEVMALPITTVTLPEKITYGGVSTSSGSTATYDSGVPEFIGNPVIQARNVTTLTPLSVFSSTYKSRGLRWQTYCIANGRAYFLNMADVPKESVVKHDTYIEIYDLMTGKLLYQKVRQNYMQDQEGLISRGWGESTCCYAEPEGIKVIGDAMYIMYTCRGDTNLTIRRPVVFKLASAI